MGDEFDRVWQLPPASLVLNDGEVHVWRASLEAAPKRFVALYDTLAMDERERAERFRFPIDRARFIVARGLLRAIIARYLSREPGAIAFQYGASGKPSLRDESGDDGLGFNVSHADGYALYAVTRGREVGVDIEAVRAGFASERIAERFFSPREVATLRALRPDLQPAAFFRCWTRKEAYVKARGTGIAAALDRFDVSLAPDEPAVILANREAGEQRHWSLHHLDPNPGYVGAVAVAGECTALTCWQWQDPCDPHEGNPGGASTVDRGSGWVNPRRMNETWQQSISDLSWNFDPRLAPTSCHSAVMDTCHRWTVRSGSGCGWGDHSDAVRTRAEGGYGDRTN